MSKIKYSKESIEFSKIAKALSHPARLEILKTLAKRNQCVCGEIVEVMPLAQSTVSQHLKELKNAGLILGEIDGPKTCYCLNNKSIQNFINNFGRFMNGICCSK